MVRDVDMDPFTFNRIQVRDCNRGPRRDLFPTFSPFRWRVIRPEHGNEDHYIVCLTQDGQDEMVPYWSLLPEDFLP